MKCTLTVLTAVALFASLASPSNAASLKYRKVPTYTDDVSALPDLPRQEVKSVLLRVEGADIRYRDDDGEQPTHYLGQLLKDGDVVCLEVNSPPDFHFIAIGKHDGSLDVSYFAGRKCSSEN